MKNFYTKVSFFECFLHVPFSELWIPLVPVMASWLRGATARIIDAKMF